jgi:hypothetical protein
MHDQSSTKILLLNCLNTGIQAEFLILVLSQNIIFIYTSAMLITAVIHVIIQALNTSI